MPTKKEIAIAATVSMLSLIAFLTIAYVAKQASLLRYDLAVTQRIHGSEQFGITQMVAFISDMGGSVLVFLILQIIVLLGYRRQWRRLMLWLGTIGGGYLLNVLLKQLLQGPRPHLEDLAIIEQSTGFPSGHAMMAIITYGLLAYGVTPLVRSRGQRLMLTGGLVLLVSLIGYSRMYLGAHYFSDILGGYAAGLFWLTFCITLEALGRTGLTAPHLSASQAVDVPMERQL